MIVTSRRHEGGYSPTNAYAWSDDDHEHSDKEQHNDTLKHTSYNDDDATSKKNVKSSFVWSDDDDDDDDDDDSLGGRKGDHMQRINKINFKPVNTLMNSPLQ